MKLRTQRLRRQERRTRQGMTLVEVLLALSIWGLAVAGIVKGYVFANTSAESFGLSLAANSQASQRMEQLRSAQWDTSSWPVVDQLTSTNFSNQVVVLESSANGIPLTYATNFVTISTISTNPPLRRIRVDCVWCFQGNRLFTNTVETCRAPNQ